MRKEAIQAVEYTIKADDHQLQLSEQRTQRQSDALLHAAQLFHESIVTARSPLSAVLSSFLKILKASYWCPTAKQHGIAFAASSAL
jgi:hypothetical protein